MWQPAILELYDSRLLPLASREYEFVYRLPDKAEGLKVKTHVQYHIVTDKQHDMLQHKYGLTGSDPYRFSRAGSLEQLKTALADSDHFPAPAASRHERAVRWNTRGPLSGLVEEIHEPSVAH